MYIIYIHACILYIYILFFFFKSIMAMPLIILPRIPRYTGKHIATHKHIIYPFYICNIISMIVI